MKSLFLSILLAIFFFFIAFQISAQVTIDNPIKADSFADLIIIIINIMWVVALAVAPLLIVVAGFMFVFSAGDPTKVNTAKQLIFWALFGLFVIFISRGIINIFNETIIT